jgi:nicotinic acid mononucleotide adenylyltransferase/nicotinamide mononucleotide (NMN) deamidase PncC
MTQPLIDSVALLGGLEESGSQVVIVATGGGSIAIPHLLATPGASSVVLECLVPYAREAVDRLLGGPQESYCSSRAARRLAVMAWQRACSLGAPPAAAIGVAATASLRSRTPKRGQHRVVVAMHGLAATSVATLVLQKDARSRSEEETVAAALLLERLAAMAGGRLRPSSSTNLLLIGGEHVEIECCEPPTVWRELLAGTLTAVHAASDPARPRPASAPPSADTPPTAGMLVFPGSFDPLHEGHLRMAIVAQEIAKRPLDFELSVTNVDKPALDYLEMESRAAQFAGRSLWFTRAATFVEKLDIFPEGTFVMGADTYARLADPKYYGGSAESAARAVQRIATQARGLIVFGRERNGVFEDPSRLDVPSALREVTTFVSQREFCMDISSTSLRRERDSAD